MTNLSVRNKNRKHQKEFSQDKDNKIYVGNIDHTILFTVILLVLFGMIMIFSASSYTSATQKKFNYDMFLFLKKQTFSVIL